ncbi:MAG: efflux RND transporter periplasmic adaptor subunit [Pseudomonadota bacterium]
MAERETAPAGATGGTVRKGGTSSAALRDGGTSDAGVRAGGTGNAVVRGGGTGNAVVRGGGTGPGGWLAATLFGGLVAASAVGAVLFLEARSAAEVGPAPRPPLTARLEPLRIEPVYTVRQSFIGRVEPARETGAAFEREGLVEAVLVDEGTTVRRGQVLARLDTEPLEIEDARLGAEGEALRAELQLAEATTKRREALKGRGFETGQSFDEARFSAGALAARIEAVEAQRRRIRLDIAKSALLAPFDGIVARRRVDEGAVVQAGTPLLVLQESTRPQARVGVPVEIARGLVPGAALELRLRGGAVEGRLVAVLPEVDPATRTVAAILDLPADALPVAGEIVRLGVERAVPSRGAWVPVGALREASRGLWSLQVAEGPEDARRLGHALVEVLHVAGDRAFVRGSLRDGMPVVTEGAHRGAAGQRVVAADAGARAR